VDGSLAFGIRGAARSPLWNEIAGLEPEDLAFAVLGVEPDERQVRVFRLEQWSAGADLDYDMSR
jgi:hypothetical protein